MQDYDCELACAYVKLSVKSNVSLFKTVFKENINFSATKNYRISFKIDNLTIFIFGTHKKHINITGFKYMPTLAEIKLVLSFCLKKNVYDNICLDFLKIDSSSFHGKLKKRFYKQLKFSQKLLNALSMHNIIIKKYPKFSGICLKFPMHYAITIFKSGKFNATGFKEKEILKNTLKFLISLEDKF